jgi:hypothetical protein
MVIRTRKFGNLRPPNSRTRKIRLKRRIKNPKVRYQTLRLNQSLEKSLMTLLRFRISVNKL